MTAEIIGCLPSSQRDPGFATAERQAAYAADCRQLGLRSVVWMHEPAGEPGVGALHEDLRVCVNPLVPNMRAYLRDASDYGVVGAALQRFRRLRTIDQLRIGLHNAPRALGVLGRDFATGVLVMADMELVRFRRFAPTMAILAASVTDLALALDNDRLLRGFVALVERSYGLVAGLETYNYGVLAERLRAWNIRPGLIAAPFNPRGHLMNPSREACERIASASSVEVVATHVEVDGLVARPDALAYLSPLGIRRAILDLGR